MNKRDLSEWVETYIAAQEQGGVDNGHPFWWAIERFFEYMPERPDDCWSAILGVLDRSSNESVLGVLGAGPLEDLIEDHGPEFIERIEIEVSENPRFKELLDCVWESSTEDVWERVQRACVGD